MTGPGRAVRYTRPGTRDRGGWNHDAVGDDHALERQLLETRDRATHQQRVTGDDGELRTAARLSQGGDGCSDRGSRADHVVHDDGRATGNVSSHAAGDHLLARDPRLVHHGDGKVQRPPVAIGQSRRAEIGCHDHALARTVAHGPRELGHGGQVLEGNPRRG